MCTVTALPRSLLSRTTRDEPLLLRVVCNRDEQRTRPPALPPIRREAGALNAVMPIDPQSGGTWIAVNDIGIVFALLNLNSGLPRTTGDLSRGLIIPTLVGCTSISDALCLAQRIEARRYQPFRLLLFDRCQLVECWPDVDRIRHRRSYLYGPLMRTSSGLGDAVVAGPRRHLFRRMLEGAADPMAAQDAFHRHQWRWREHVSIRMERADACTVSHTVVEIGLGSISMSYRPSEFDRAFVVQVAAGCPC